MASKAYTTDFDPILTPRTGMTSPKREFSRRYVTQIEAPAFEPLKAQLRAPTPPWMPISVQNEPLHPQGGTRL